ncbi:MAG TPA: helicase HerA-like domain-containing protein [Edaphocola sp.]|nr:helicase HerA-like domain-containing protein [Edaphocola sp.]
MDNQKFSSDISTAYTFSGESFKIGSGMLDKKVWPEAAVNMPLRMFNRHGLIAGATGTGKTKTLQLIMEGLSDAGVPVLAMDIKGDLSGLAMAGVPNDRIKERYQQLQENYQPRAYPVEFLSLSQEPGTRLKATVTEFGPLLMAKVLDLNDTQEGLLAVLFKYCDDQGLPLLDLKDLTEVLQYAGAEGKAVIEKEYGKISISSLGTIQRKIIALEQQGADLFFGERSFEIKDLMRFPGDGKGMLSVLRLMDMQEHPGLFATFMLQLLGELYATMPEAGDLGKPKLVLFIDEAHLIFKNGTSALLEQIETIVKLIRSKGVGIFFCTQDPTDIPDSVLSQLGFKIQHALRAFTANDRKAIKKTAENYPLSDYYQTDELLTQMGIGEAMITLLNEKGIPTTLVHTFLMTPRSRMGVISAAELSQIVASSSIAAYYNERLDRQSAFEIIQQKTQQYAQASAAPAPKASSVTPPPKTGEEQSWLGGFLNSSVGKQVQRSLVRTFFGVLSRAIK